MLRFQRLNIEIILIMVQREKGGVEKTKKQSQKKLPEAAVH